MNNEPPLTEWAQNVLEKSFRKFLGRPLLIPPNHIAEADDLVSRGLVQKQEKTANGKTFVLYSGTLPADAPPSLEMPIEQDPK